MSKSRSSAKKTHPAPQRLGFDWVHLPKPIPASAVEPSLKQRSVDASGLPLRSGRGGYTGGLGYHPDLTDLRDTCIGTVRAAVKSDAAPPESVSLVRNTLAKLEDLNRESAKRAGLPAASVPKSYLLGEEPLPENGKVDLRSTGFLSAVEDQGNIGSCTSHAVIGLVEYLMRAGQGVSEDMSRLFLYRTTRRLLRWTGDTGAYLRTTIKAIRLFGVPPEEFWAYDPSRFDEEPDSFLYSFAQNYRGMAYLRLDDYNATGDENLNMMKRSLLDGFPVAFGFPVYESIERMAPGDGDIPFPKPTEKVLGGHAVLAVGFDDENQQLIIRNSWGPWWGEQGYGRLPYRYVEDALALDCWTLFNQDWIDPRHFYP